MSKKMTKTNENLIEAIKNVIAMKRALRASNNELLKFVMKKRSQVAKKQGVGEAMSYFLWVDKLACENEKLDKEIEELSSFLEEIKAQV